VDKRKAGYILEISGTYSGYFSIFEDSLLVI